MALGPLCAMYMVQMMTNDDWIDADRSGFLKGRYIGQNITTVFDIMHFVDSEYIPSILVSVDLEKALDELDWSYIHKCLENYEASNKAARYHHTYLFYMHSC